MMDKRPIKLKFENKTNRDNQELALSSDIIDKFKENNNLDYSIYNYGLKKFNQNMISMGFTN
jgi:hypothetical protein